MQPHVPAATSGGANGRPELQAVSEISSLVILACLRKAGDSLFQGVIEFSLCLLFAKLVSYTFLFWLPLYITNVGECLSRGTDAQFWAVAGANALSPVGFHSLGKRKHA